jgi:N-acetylglucosaminyl-diphospho-decaprenol L-rhamnosyltransferase
MSIDETMGTMTRSDEGVHGRYDVILVTYHSRDQLAGLLAAVPFSQSVVVVDNASGADGVDLVVATMPNGRWVDGHDRGFAASANVGAAHSTAEYLVFANPDSRPTPEIWEQLIDDLESDPTLGSVAAATADPSGHIEIGVGGWEPTLRRCVVHALGLHKLMPSAGVYARPAVGQHVELEWLTGACLAVRRDVFERVGGFDERYFVYNEDMAFGRQLREHGYGQRLRTDLLVPHAAGGSGGGSTKMPQQRGASMVTYLEAYNGPTASRAMRFVLGAGMFARAMAAAVSGRRGLARKHLAYVRGIATGRSPYRAGR